MVNVSGSEPLAPPAPASPAPSHPVVHYVDWPAALAGAVVAAAIAFILGAFGSALGLSLVSPFEGVGLGSTGLLVAIGLWSLWVAASSFMAGGYLTGRLRHRVHDASEHESDVRDGAHGLVVWGVGVLFGALLLAAGASGTARVGAQAVQAAGEAGAAAAAPASGPDLRYLADSLLRPSGEQPAVQPPPPANRELGGEIGRIFRHADADKGLAEDDRAYLTSLIVQRTGISRDEAQARLKAVENRYAELRQKAQEAADAARKLSIAAAFLLAASLLVGGAGAWYAAQLGGRHRDEQTVFPLFGRRP